MFDAKCCRDRKVRTYTDSVFGVDPDRVVVKCVRKRTWETLLELGYSAEEGWIARAPTKASISQVIERERNQKPI